jgi:hypothetical protein
LWRQAGVGGQCAASPNVASHGAVLAEFGILNMKFFRFDRDKIRADLMGQIIAGTPGLVLFT